ncbi:diguanylate cyclase [Massilia sp. CCM 8695]|uniref:Diguanylate cyclase n=1 Tax=Massilia frigida TaxID=2609281 RepID=A0ABX0NB51_9BURK|nr:diguanylate cyclase [Massilia frigida]
MTLAMHTVIDDVDDAARVRALEALALLDTPPEERFDRLTKTINDTLGHAGGDAVLKEFGRRLTAAVRKTGTVCRLAGDEFSITLENVESAAECDTVG